MKTTISLLLASLVLIAGQSYAGQGQGQGQRQRNNDQGARQHNQQDRIRDGVRSGELTKEEVKGLQQERQAIREEAKEYRSDGVMTKEERKDLRQDVNEFSKDIYEQKHDNDVRPKVTK